MPKDAVAWYQDFLKKVYETPEFKKYMDEGALKAAFATGAEFVKWVGRARSSSTGTSWRRAGSSRSSPAWISPGDPDDAGAIACARLT